jgi:hypothetical protein
VGDEKPVEIEERGPCLAEAAWSEKGDHGVGAGEEWEEVGGYGWGSKLAGDYLGCIRRDDHNCSESISDLTLSFGDVRMSSGSLDGFRA